ncbi:MAG: formimidoylglutamate deiminase [Pseudomonadota bacterium]
MATDIFAKRALLPDGWARNIQVRMVEGRITSISQTKDARQAPAEAVRVDILLPALANLHSHAFQRAMAGMTETRGPGEQDSFWTWRRLMYRFLERLDPAQVEAIAAQVYVEMLEAGYASVGEFHYLHHGPGGVSYDDPAEMSVRIAAAAAKTGIGITHLPVLYAQGGSDGRALAGGQLRFGTDLDGFADLTDRAAAAITTVGPDAKTGVAPHSLRAVGVEALTAVQSLRADAPIHMHIAEQRAEVVEILGTHGATPVKWLLEIMDVDTRWCLIHATHMDRAETEGLARSGAVAGLCPITEANLGDGIFNGASYLAADGRLGVGSDSNVRIALAEELRTLENGQRLQGKARAVLAGPEASTGRTLYGAALAGGAQALGRASGAIEEGIWADLVALDGDALALAGLDGDALLDGWIFAGDDTIVKDVWSAGRHVVRDGRHIARDRIEAAYRSAITDLRAEL